MESQRNRVHKQHVVGAKAKKQADVHKRKEGLEVEANRGNNPKAFMGPSNDSHKIKAMRHSLEKREHTYTIPELDGTLSSILEEPPVLVAVVGPPGCGKTTLIRSLVRLYSNRNMKDVRGAVTVIAGRSRRITFIECPNTLASMCDVAKTADLILLVVDGAFGFEMETFEFLNIAQVHGLPRIIGVVSHLDTLKNSKALKKRKKFLRHRFWHEVVDGATMICLGPMQHGLYRSTDILKLHQLLICANIKTQQWRNTHSCILADRWEDLTDPDQVAKTPEMSRTIAFYGYVRGKPFKPRQKIHIPGLGDFQALFVSHQDDPCAFENIKKGTSAGHRMRHLSTKQKQIYAPYSDVGGILYSEDAVYVRSDAERENVERSGEGVELMRGLQQINIGVDEAANKAKLNIFLDDDEEQQFENKDPLSRGARRPVFATNAENNFGEEAIASETTMENVNLPEDFNKEGYTFDDEDEDDSNYDELSLKDSIVTDYNKIELDEYGLTKSVTLDDVLTENLTERAENGTEYLGLLYPYELIPREANEIDTNLIRTIKHNWTCEKLLANVKNVFVTGKWKTSEGGIGQETNCTNSEEEAESDKGYESEDEEFQRLIRGTTKDENSVSKTRMHMTGHSSSKRAGSHSETDSDYDILKEKEEDESTGMEFQDPGLSNLVDHFISRDIKDDDGQLSYNDRTGEENRLGGITINKPYNEDENDTTLAAGEELTDEQADLMKKRIAKKQMFNELYDSGKIRGNEMLRGNTQTTHYRKLLEAKEQKERELSEALLVAGDDLEKKISLVGYFSGLYIRIVIEQVPVEFVRSFDPSVPVIIGGLANGEDELHFVHARIKRHRWYPRILKALDPLMISMGWRRFQTQPVFSAEDPNGRLRYLKYTPLHMFCYTTFFGPTMPPGTGFVVLPSENLRTPGFRLRATGYTVGNDETSCTVKKLKLVGYVDSVQKTTAFVKGMFNSDIEAAKFVGAKVKSVSGLRGIIKAAIKGKQGLVRCTFEDKLLSSDIVFFRTWKPLDPPRYCAMAPTLLDKDWKGMRTKREVMRELNVQPVHRPDSEYIEVKKRRVIADEEPVQVLVSRNLQHELPFNLKEDYVSIGQKGLVSDSSAERQRRIIAATTVAPTVRTTKKRTLLDAFRAKADKIDQQKQLGRKKAKEKREREEKKEEEQYKANLKKAKKETARMLEFRAQHKIRK